MYIKINLNFTPYNRLDIFYSLQKVHASLCTQNDDGESNTYPYV